MTKRERFIDVLKTFEEAVTIREWAKRVGEVHPSIFKQINSNSNELMTMQDLVAMLSLKVSNGEFSEVIVCEYEPERKVKYASEMKRSNLFKKVAVEEVESFIAEHKVKQDIKKSTDSDRYRLEEIKSIADQLNRYFNLNFQLNHVSALKDENKTAKHHISNLEILTQEHAKLKKDGAKRFSIEEQSAYIKRVIVIHMMINKDITLIDEVLDMLLERLGKIY